MLPGPAELVRLAPTAGAGPALSAEDMRVFAMFKAFMQKEKDEGSASKDAYGTDEVGGSVKHTGCWKRPHVFGVYFKCELRASKQIAQVGLIVLV